MSVSETEPAEPAAVLSDCPQCHAELAILRVIPGRSGSEYWALRCTRCGGIHLDIVKAPPSTASAC
nr:zf-TFIIB domain-containing protein [Bradyrhizobium erythrophlei]